MVSHPTRGVGGDDVFRLSVRYPAVTIMTEEAWLKNKALLQI